MKQKTKIIALYTRINGVEKTQVHPDYITSPVSTWKPEGYGLDINRDFHRALGISTAEGDSNENIQK